MKAIVVLFILSLSFSVDAQVTPNTNMKKAAKVTYKTLPAPVIPDPYSELREYTSVPVYGSPPPVFQHGGQSQENKRQIDQYERDLAEYRSRQQHAQGVLTEFDRDVAAMNRLRVAYDYPMPHTRLQQKFEASFVELQAMLGGDVPVELTRAQYLVESTYDHRLTYQLLKQSVLDLAYISQVFMKKEGLPEGANLSKIMAIFQVMADTTTTKVPWMEGALTTYPLLYDFDDPWGVKDFTKMFVIKLLSTGTGNCTSLPRLFLMIAEALGAEAYLSFAPQHSYVKFQDGFGEWHNVELTNQMFTTDDHIMEYGWVKSEAVRSGIYMNPITKTELIAHLVNELAMSHQRIFGNTPFMTKCTQLALTHYPESIFARQINANYYTELVDYIVKQYQEKGLSQAQFDQDQKVTTLIEKVNTSYLTIDELGYSDVPEDLYNEWIKAMNNEENREKSRNTMRQMIQSINR
ncbi:MAG: hypothetical protein AAF551_04020 [Bacteroidota bacterium]